jgi:hypothetical protein
MKLLGLLSLFLQYSLLSLWQLAFPLQEKQNHPKDISQPMAKFIGL